MNLLASLFGTGSERQRWDRLILGTGVLAGLAVLGNMLAVPLFFGVDLIFGSVAVLVAVARLGLVPGLLVAVVGGLYTVALWGHPYALVIFSLEALVVGWLLQRGSYVVLADVAYWLVLGVPLVVVFYGGVMEMGGTATTLIALKQPMNGIVNAVLASFLLMASQLPAVTRLVRSCASGVQQLSLRNLLFSLLFAALLLPALAFIAVEAHYHRQHMEQDLANRMDLAASLVASELSVAEGEEAERVRRARERMAESHGLRFAFQDEAGRLVGGNDQVDGERGERHPARVSGLALRIDPTASGTAMQRMRRADYEHRAVVPDHPSITRVVVQAPAEPLVDRLQAYYIRQLAGLAVFAVLAALGAALVSRWLTRPLQEVNRVGEDLPERIMEGRVTAPHMKRTGLSEFDELAQNLRRMALSMASGYSELRTTRDNLERRVAERTHALERNNAELRRLAEVAAHHLMEPVRRMMAYTQRLQRDLPESVAGRPDWKRMEQQIERMSALLEDLQRYLAHRTTLPARETVRPERVVARALTMLEAGSEASAPVRVTFDPDPPPPIYADYGELLELFRQLLANARAYARPDVPPELHIRVEEGDAGIHFTLRDNGRGFEPEYGERIFRLFERLYQDRDGAGTGLGLALARRIVENHGGWMTAESPGPGQGATIRFLLPGRETDEA